MRVGFPEGRLLLYAGQTPEHSCFGTMQSTHGGHLTLWASNSKQILFSRTKGHINRPAPKTPHTPVLVGVISKLPKAEWVLGVTHSDKVPCTTAIRRKRLGLQNPVHLFLFLPAFCSNFPGVLAPHKPTSGISGKEWPGRRGQYPNPTREGGRKERRREISVSICHQMQVSPVSCPAALGSGGWLFPEANLSITWATTSPRTLFQWLLSPVINCSSVWPDLVSNNSPHFEMQVGALFCFTFLFLLTFGEMEVLCSVVKPHRSLYPPSHSYAHCSASCLLFEESFLLKLQST